MKILLEFPINFD